MSGTPDASPRAVWLALGLAFVLCLATLGEGGGSPGSLLLWHAVLVLLVTGCVLWPRPADDPSRAPVRVPLAALAVFALLVVLGALRAPYFYGALLPTLELAACVTVALLAAAAGPGWLQTAVWPLRIAAALHGLFVLVQFTALDETRPAGTFLNPNHTGAWLTVVVLLGLGLPNGASRARRNAAWALAVPALVGVLVSASRGAMVALVAGVVVLVLLSWQRLARPARTALAASLALLVVLLGAVIAHRLTMPDPFRYHRVGIWKASLGAVLDDPLWGSGPGQFEVAAANLRFDDGQGALRYDRSFAVTHSDLLRVPCELGLPAALALLAAAGLSILELGRRRRSGSLPPGAEGAIAGLAAIAVQAVFDNPSRWPSVYLLVSCLVGWLLSTPSYHSFRPRQGARLTLAAGIVLALCVADVGPAMAWFKASRLPRGPLGEEQSRQLDRALALNRVHPDLWARRAESRVRKDWTLADYAVAREAAEHAVRLQPADARYHWGLAQVEARACLSLFFDEATRDRAVRHFEAAAERSRYDARIPIDAGDFLLSAGDAAGARRMAERALKVEPAAVPAMILLAEAVLEQDRTHTKMAADLLARARSVAREHEREARESRYSGELLRLDPTRTASVEVRAAEPADLASSSSTSR